MALPVPLTESSEACQHLSSHMARAVSRWRRKIFASGWHGHGSCSTHRLVRSPHRCTAAIAIQFHNIINITPSVIKGPIHVFTLKTPSLAYVGYQVQGFHWSKSQYKQTIITEVVVIWVRAWYTLCHDMCHVCMMDSISNLLLIVDY